VVVGDRVLAEPDNRALLAALVGAGALPASDAAAHVKDHNVGDLDRALRTIAAVATFVGAARAPRLLRWPVRAGAIVLALTAVRAWCPVYDACQVTSMDGPGDRPDAAERSAWLASTAQPPVWSGQ
jgi:hypothetical protein